MPRKELYFEAGELFISDLGGVNMERIQATDLDTVVTAVGVLDAAAVAAIADGQVFTGLVTGPMVQVTSTARTATADGLTTGIIAAGTSFVAVTSANAAHIIALPATVAGLRISGYVGANGFELLPAASSGINGGIGSSFSSAIGANLYWEVVAVSATQWLGSTMTVAGVKAAMAVSD